MCAIDNVKGKAFCQRTNGGYTSGSRQLFQMNGLQALLSKPGDITLTVLHGYNGIDGETTSEHLRKSSGLHSLWTDQNPFATLRKSVKCNSFDNKSKKKNHSSYQTTSKGRRSLHRANNLGH